MNMLKAMVLGFIAGAIATVTVHEIISAVFNNTAYWTGWGRVSWDLSPNEFGVPKLRERHVLGRALGRSVPGHLRHAAEGSADLQGPALRLIGPALIGVFIAVPLLTQRFPIFMDGRAELVVPVLVILAGFGAALGWLYGFFAYKRLPC